MSPPDRNCSEISEKLGVIDRIRGYFLVYPLRSFGTAVSHWKKIVPLMVGKDRTYLFTDEPWSSTNTTHREALNFAIAALALEHGVTATIATHSIPPVEAFLATYPTAAKAVHFGTNTDDQGKLTFTYEKLEGISDSQALEVAASLGFNSDILAWAQELPAPHEIRKVRRASLG